ncbi:heparinase II/III family protein [Paenibacillus sp. CC-CFT747]|nr:heparinase II/III family protein [Paenibacillus sp. CC-CFT747]
MAARGQPGGRLACPGSVRRDLCRFNGSPRSLGSGAGDGQCAGHPSLAEPDGGGAGGVRPPKVDGRLEEAVWQTAPALGDFVTFYDNRPADPTTQVQVAYDSGNLYLAIRGQVSPDSTPTLLEEIDVVVKPSGDSADLYQIPIRLETQSGKNYLTELGPGVSVLNEEEFSWAKGQSDKEWTVEARIPLSSLGTSAIQPGDEWGFNVLRYRHGSEPASSWVPVRQSFFDDLPARFKLQAAVGGENRLGSLSFRELPKPTSFLPERKNGPWKVSPWKMSSLRVQYDGFAEKTLTLRKEEGITPDSLVKILWQTPSGKRTVLDTQTEFSQGEWAVHFIHPGMLEAGLYRLEIWGINETSGQLRRAVLLLDREDAIAAGEKAARHPEPDKQVTEVVYAPASEPVQKLIDLIPDKVGFIWAGLPDHPELRPYQLFNWSPDKPDQLTSPKSPLTYPNPLYPEDKVLTAVNALGQTVEYPYYEDSEGRRYFHTAHVWFKQKEYTMTQTKVVAASDPLGAARMLYRFAQVYPGYVPVQDYTWYNYPLDAKAGPPNPYWGGVWTRWFYNDLAALSSLSNAFAAVDQTNAFDLLSKEVRTDVRKLIVDSVFKPSVDFNRSYAVLNSNVDYNVWKGLIQIGNDIGEPDYVHDAIERLETYTANNHLFDGFWKEVTVSYHNQSTNGLLANLQLLDGWSDPAGYVPPRTGTALSELDEASRFPILNRSREIPRLTAYPNGSTLPIQDTWASEKVANPNTGAGSFLLPASGIARLTAGEGVKQSQLYMMFEPKYGHVHHDPLNLALFANGQELLPDLGYTHTKYRQWATSTLSHNTVVVDGKDAVSTDAAKHGGSIRTFADSKDGVQVMQASQEPAYPGVSQYMREPWFIPFANAPVGQGYVLDLFRVKGGSRHEYTLQGDATRDGEFTTSLPLKPYGPYLLPPGTPVVEPELETDKGSAGGEYYGYLYVRDVQSAKVEDGRYEVALKTTASGQETGSLFIHGLTEPGENELFLGRSPDIRSTRQDTKKDSNDLVDKTTMPKLVLRREGTNLTSTFITALEPAAAGVQGRIESVERLQASPSAEGDTAVAVHYGNTTDIILSSPLNNGKPFVVGDMELTGKLGFVRLVNGAVTEMKLLAGTTLKKGSRIVEGQAASGTIDDVWRAVEGKPYDAFVTKTAVPSTLAGRTVIVTHPDGTAHGYRVKEIRKEGRIRIWCSTTRIPALRSPANRPPAWCSIPLPPGPAKPVLP